MTELEQENPPIWAVRESQTPSPIGSNTPVVDKAWEIWYDGELDHWYVLRHYVQEFGKKSRAQTAGNMARTLRSKTPESWPPGLWEIIGVEVREASDSFTAHMVQQGSDILSKNKIVGTPNGDSKVYVRLIERYELGTPVEWVRPQPNKSPADPIRQQQKQSRQKQKQKQQDD